MQRVLKEPCPFLELLVLIALSFSRHWALCKAYCTVRSNFFSFETEFLFKNLKAVLVQVDFDKSKHLSESMIKKRKEERERLIKEEADKEENEKKRSKLETLQKKEQMWVSKKCCDCDEQCVSWIPNGSKSAGSIKFWWIGILTFLRIQGRIRGNLGTNLIFLWAKIAFKTFLK